MARGAPENDPPEKSRRVFIFDRGAVAMVHALITVLVICLVVFLIEKFLAPPDPWRTVFRVIAVVIAIFVLLSLVYPFPIVGL